MGLGKVEEAQQIQTTFLRGIERVDTGERVGREEKERGYMGIDKGEGKAYPLNGLYRRQRERRIRR